MLTIVREPDYKKLVTSFVARFESGLRGAFDDVFAPAWVITPSRAIERWLGLQYSMSVEGAEGVATNWNHQLPGALITLVLGEHWKQVGNDDGDPWDLTQMAFHLFTLVERVTVESQSPSWLSLFAGSGSEVVPSFARVHALADLFDRYHRWDPDRVVSWQLGEEPDEPQANLWRALRVAIGEESPAERLAPAIEALRDGRIALPSKNLFIFGLAQFPGGATFVDLLGAMASRIDVHLFLVDPSPNLPAVGSANLQLLDLWGSAIRQTHEHLHHLDCALLELGIPLRDASSAVDAAAASTFSGEGRGPEAGDQGLSSRPGTTFLAVLQRAIASNALPSGGSERADDGSIALHECAGAARQVEVARDLILGLLVEEDDGVRRFAEEEIVVVVPDLDKFEPLIRSTFGGSRDFASSGGGRSSLPALSYRIVDPSKELRAGFRETLDLLFDLLIGRFTSLETLTFLEAQEVLTRFRLTDRATSMVRAWMEEARTAWGLDRGHRATFGVQSFDDGVIPNSFAALLDRLHLGLAVDEFQSSLIEEIAAIAVIEVDIDDLEVVAFLSEALALLSGASATVHSSRMPLGEWLVWVEALVDAILDPGPVNRWQRVEFGQAIERIRTGMPDLEVVVGFGDLRTMLDRVWRRRTVAPDLFGGGIMVVPPATLRYIEHKVVIVLGFDDGAFEGARTNADDLLFNREGPSRVLSPAEEARNSLLSVVLQAKERLLITRSARSLRDNSAVESSVAMDEFLDGVAELTAALRGQQSLATISHRRHGFHESNFTVDDGGPWSFDEKALEIAERLRHKPTLLAQSSEPQPKRTVELNLTQLAKVLSAPLEQFARLTLGVAFPSAEEKLTEEVVVELSGLEKWEIIDELLPGAQALGTTKPSWLALGGNREAIEGAFDHLAATGAVPIRAAWAKRDEQVLLLSGLRQLAVDVLRESASCSVLAFRREVHLGPLTVVVADEIELHQWTDGTSGPLYLTNSKLSEKALVRPALELLALHDLDPRHTAARYIAANPSRPTLKVGRALTGTLAIADVGGGCGAPEATIDDAIRFAALCLLQRIPYTFNEVLSLKPLERQDALRPSVIAYDSFGGTDTRNPLRTWMLEGFAENFADETVIEDALLAELSLVAVPEATIRTIVEAYLGALFSSAGRVPLGTPSKEGGAS